jgi:hypothetical protein
MKHFGIRYRDAWVALFAIAGCAVGLFGGARTYGAGMPKPQVAIPAGPEILKLLRPGHPRLVATTNDFARLKDRIASDPRLQKWVAQVRSQGDDILKAPPSRYEIPDGLRLLATSRQVMNRMYILGLLHHLDPQPKYAQRAWQELEAAAHFQDWNTRHFLDTAEMTHAFAIGYDWFYDSWTPEQRAVLRGAMLEKGLTPALELYRKGTKWTRVRHNWNQVCNGGIAMGALALAETDPAPAGEILHSALESIQLAMAEFSPDGAWKEGPGYWNYATIYNVVLLAGLQSALGTDFGLARIDSFSETGFFPIYLSGPLGRTFNYADGGDYSFAAPQMFWLAREYQQPVFAWYEQQKGGGHPLDVVWYDSDAKSPKAAGLPLDRYFRGSEVVTLRSAWDDSSAIFVGFKAGDNKANHSHLDLGSFVMDALGVRWAVDLGGDDYNLPAYFGEQRWTYYRLRAEGQNTLLINPGEGPDQAPKAASKIVRFSSRPERSFAIADLSAAYPGATRVQRGIALLNRQEVLVQDEITALKPASIWWFMHTPAAVQVEEGGSGALLRQAGVELRARILSPPEARFQIVPAEPLPTSPHPAGQAKNEKTRKLSIHLGDVRDTRIVVLLTPQTDHQSSTNPAPAISALSAW